MSAPAMLSWSKHVATPFMGGENTQWHPVVSTAPAPCLRLYAGPADRPRPGVSRPLRRRRREPPPPADLRRRAGRHRRLARSSPRPGAGRRQCRLAAAWLRPRARRGRRSPMAAAAAVESAGRAAPAPARLASRLAGRAAGHRPCAGASGRTQPARHHRRPAPGSPRRAHPGPGGLPAGLCRPRRVSRRRPRSAATGIVLKRRPRPRSAVNRIGRRRRRSAQTPANNPSSRKGAVPAAASRPIWAGVACRLSTAVSGSASPVMAEPKTEIVWPAHNFRKSG